MDYISKQEVMKRMNWTRHTFEMMRRDKGMPVYSIGYKRYVRLQEFQEWMEQHKDQTDFQLKVWS